MRHARESEGERGGQDAGGTQVDTLAVLMQGGLMCDSRSLPYIERGEISSSVDRELESRL